MSTLERVLEDLIETVLPLCGSRPTVYNCVAKWTRQLEKSVDQSQMEKAHRLKVPYEPIRRPSYVYCIPHRPEKTAKARENDILLLDHIMVIATKVQPKILEKLNELKLELLEELQALLKDHEDNAVRRTEQAKQDVQFYQIVLPLFEETPHVYNHIVNETQKLQVMVPVAEPQGSCLPLFSTGSTKAVAPVSWLPESLPTAHDRWMDVRKIDEVLDSGYVEMSGKCNNARHALQEFQRKCKAEAKNLQRQEAARMTRHLKSRMLPVNTNNMRTVY